MVLSIAPLGVIKMQKIKLSTKKQPKAKSVKKKQDIVPKTTRRKKLETQLSEVRTQGENREINVAAITADAADVAANVAATAAADAAAIAADAAADAAAITAAAAADAAAAAKTVAAAVADAASIAAASAAAAATTAAAVVTAAVTAAAAAAAKAAAAAADAATAAATAATAAAAAAAATTATAADTAATAAADAATTATSALVESEIQRGHQEELAQTDRLTELGNQSGFFEDLDRQLRVLIRYKHPAALAIIDIDDFKDVNDTRGHLAGNRLLRTLGKTIRQSIRASDLAGRIGGDEFAILFPETEPDKAKEVVEKLFDALCAATKGEFPEVTFSVGVAGYHNVPDKYEDMVRAADQLMYEVKNKGKNSVSLKIIN